MERVIPVPRALLPVLCALYAAGCGGEALHLAELPEVDLVVELLVEGPVDAVAAVPGLRALVAQDGEIFLVEPGEEGVIEVDAGSLVDATTLASGELLVATEADTRVWVEGQLLPSELDAAVGAPVQRILASEELRWLHTGSRLWRLDGEVLDEIGLKGSTLTGAIALGPGARPDLWLATDDGLVGLDGTTMEAFDKRAGMEVEQLAVDAGGEVWALGEERLWHREAAKGRWRRVRGDVDVYGVFADPGAGGVWLHSSGGLLHAVGDAVWRADEDGGVAMRVDPLGRLLVATDEGLLRLGTERIVAVAGLREGELLLDPREVVLEPSRVGAIAWLRASIDGTPVEVVEGRLVVEPGLLAEGEIHTLEATASWEDGVEAYARPVSFEVSGVGEATWAGQVEPLFADRCASCHDGASKTQLDTPEAWEDRIETLLDLVRQGSMPIGGEALSDREVATIEAWRDGGYP